jgi:phage major head subunit gpT-like protein
MPAMINENWPNLLTPGLRNIWFLQMRAVVDGDPLLPLFNVANSAKAVENTLGVGGMSDIPEYNGVIEYENFDEDYLSTFTHTEYARGITIERRLIDDDLYNVINGYAMRMGLAFGRTRAKARANIFNNAFVTTATVGPDTFALCSASHTYGKNNSTAQTNTGTSPLTADNIIATRTDMKAFKDDEGEVIPSNPDTIVCGRNLEGTAWVAVNTLNKPGSANNDRNFAEFLGFNVLVSDYMTDTNNWFLVDSSAARMHLWWFNRVLPEFALDPTSNYNLAARYRGYMRYVTGFDDYRWVYGHNVA